MTGLRGVAWLLMSSPFIGTTHGWWLQLLDGQKGRGAKAPDAGKRGLGGAGAAFWPSLGWHPLSLLSLRCHSNSEADSCGLAASGWLVLLQQNEGDAWRDPLGAPELSGLPSLCHLGLCAASSKDLRMGSQPHLVLGANERECKICYERFDLCLRRPKLLSCQHRLCALCLCKMVDVGDSQQGCFSCPFCRQQTSVPDKEPNQLPDDTQLLALLSCQEWGTCKPGGALSLSPEVLLCPSILEPCGEGKDGSSDCLVITLLEVPEDLAAPEGLGILDVMRLYRPPSMASLPPCHGPLARCPSRSAWQAILRFLVGVLCLAYFSSLPFGIYLLLVERLHLGVILVSLVPSTLLLCIFYSLCQCLCHEIFDLPS